MREPSHGLRLLCETQSESRLHAIAVFTIWCNNLTHKTHGRETGKEECCDTKTAIGMLRQGQPTYSFGLGGKLKNYYEVCNKLYWERVTVNGHRA